MLVLRLGMVVLALCLPGCLDEESLPSAYQDADVRARNDVAGEDAVTKTIDIAAGTSMLTVKAWYDVVGEADFVLKNPAGVAVREDHPEGVKELRDDAWFQQANPVPGPWTLHLALEGTGEYTFGAYF